MKNIISILICGIMIFALIGCGTTSTAKEETKETVKEEVTKKEETKKEEVKDVYAVGEEVSLDNKILIVNKVEKSQGSEYNKPKDGQEFVIIDVTIKNNDDKEITYTPYDFEVQNSKGNITNITFTTANTDTALSSGKLASGGTVTGTIAFEEPIDDLELILKYKTSFFGDKEIKVKLN